MTTVLLLMWIPQLALVAAPVVLVMRSKTVRGIKKGLWIAAFVVTYYVAPIPAYIYAKDRLAETGPVDLATFMTLSTLEYACIAIAFWLLYLGFWLTMRIKRGDKDGNEAA